MTAPSHDLSIVIVSWNTLEITRACLRSVFDNLGDLRAEVFVVDNASSDGSADMVAGEFPAVRLIRNADNRGFAAANNQALRVANARHHLLLNSDTVVLGDALVKSVEYMDAHDEVGVFGCRVLNTDRTMQATCFMYPSLLNLLLLLLGVENRESPRFCGRRKMLSWKRDSEREVDVVTGCYLMVRDEAMARVGLLDEAFFFFGEETDWCRRFSKAGWKVRFAPVGEIVHIGGASATKLNARRDLLLSQGLVRLHRKHGGVPGAAAAWVILWLFNASRAIGWRAVSALRRTNGGQARDRARHFVEVTRGFGQAWPRTAERAGA